MFIELIFSIMLISLVPDLVSSFRLGNGVLYTPDGTPLKPKKGEIFVSKNLKWAAIYELEESEIKFYRYNGEELFRVKAKYPIVKFEDEGIFAVIEPSTLKLRIFNSSGEPLLEYQFRSDFHTYEPYYAFEMRGNIVAFAFNDGGSTTHLVLFKDFNKIKEIVFKGIYPAGLWVSDKKEIWFSHYSVEKGSISFDRVSVFSDKGELLKTLKLHKIKCADFSGERALLASKKKVYLLENYEVVLSHEFDELVIDVKVNKDHALVLTGNPEFTGEDYEYSHLRLYNLLSPEKPVMEIAQSSLMPLIVVKGNYYGVYLPETGKSFLKEGK